MSIFAPAGTYATDGDPASPGPVFDAPHVDTDTAPRRRRGVLIDRLRRTVLHAVVGAAAVTGAFVSGPIADASDSAAGDERTEVTGEADRVVSANVDSSLDSAGASEAMTVPERVPIPDLLELAEYLRTDIRSPELDEITSDDGLLLAWTSERGWLYVSLDEDPRIWCWWTILVTENGLDVSPRHPYVPGAHELSLQAARAALMTSPVSSFAVA